MATTWTQKYFNPAATGGDGSGDSEANGYTTVALCNTGLGANVSTPTIVNCKQQASIWDPFTGTGTKTFTTEQGFEAPLMFRGYETSIGDGGYFGWNSRYNNCNIFWSGNGVSVSQWYAYNTSGTCNQSCSNQADGALMFDCHIMQSSTNNGSLSCEAENIINCSVNTNGQSTVAGVLGTENSNRGIIFGCWGKGGVRLSPASRSCVVLNNVIANDVTSGYQGASFNTLQYATGALLCAGNAFYNTDNGIELNSAGGLDLGENSMQIFNNVFDSVRGYCIKDMGGTGSGNGMPYQHWDNYYYNLDSGYTDFAGGTMDFGNAYNTQLTVSPFVDPANGDFRLNRLAGGGAVLRARGMPNYFNFVDSTIKNYMDVAGFQMDPNNGLMVPRGMAGGVR